MSNDNVMCGQDAPEVQARRNTERKLRDRFVKAFLFHLSSEASVDLDYADRGWIEIDTQGNQVLKIEDRYLDWVAARVKEFCENAKRGIVVEEVKTILTDLEEKIL